MPAKPSSIHAVLPIPTPATEALRRLEALRPRQEALTAERLRAEGDVARLESELAEARAEARRLFGTDEPAAIAAALEAARRADACDLDAFAAELAAIEARLDAAAGAA